MDEEEEEADVDEGGQRDGQGEEQGPDSLGRLDQTEDTSDPEDTDHAEQRGRHEVALDQLLHSKTWKYIYGCIQWSVRTPSNM